MKPPFSARRGMVFFLWLTVGTGLAASPELKTSLLDLARKKFAAEGLTIAEEQLFKNAETGDRVTSLTYDESKDDPNTAACWQSERVIRANRLAWLCTDREASSLISYRGLVLHGFRIDGNLNLEDSVLSFPIAAWKCAFEEILLRRTRMRSLYLLDSTVKNIRADDARIEGNVLLQFGFTSRGEINFSSAIIDGEFNLEGAHLSNPDGRALDASGAKITGGVALLHGFSATGELFFVNANIQGDLMCSGAQLHNPGKTTLDASATRIGGNAFLRNQFHSEGTVSFLAASIGGSLECDHGEFFNPEGKAIDANSSRIGGSVFFRDHFASQGEIDLVTATVGGNFECDSATLRNPGKRAMNAYALKVSKSMFLRNDFVSEGSIFLVDATIEGDFECNRGRFLHPKARPPASETEVLSSSAQENDPAAIYAAGIKVNGTMWFGRGFVADGGLYFVNGTIGGNLVLEFGELRNPPGYALNAENIKIDGNLYVSGTMIDGGINLFSARVATDFQWNPKQLSANSTLDLRNARTAILEDTAASWPGAGHLLLDGFIYERIVDGSPVEARTRTDWLDRQPDGKFRPQPYEQLASVLRTMGYEREAREIMIQKNRARANFTTPFWREWWWYNLFGWSIGYGYAPLRAFLISLAMIALGGVVFEAGYRRNLIRPTNEAGYCKDSAGQVVIENGRRTVSEDYPKFNAFVYSLESFTPLLKLDQSSNWSPNAHCGRDRRLGPFHYKSGGAVRAYLWIHIIAGWVLTTLWVGGVTGLVKT